MALYDVSTTEKKTSPELVAGGTLYADSPIGTILPYGGATAPSGWFLCDGTAISRTTYSELFAVIGTAFGSGDGSTTFNVPDLRGKVPVGFNTSETEFNALGNTGGEKTHKLTVSEIPSHSHKVSDSDSKKGIYDNFVDSSSGTYNRTTFQSCSAVSDPIDTTSTGGSTAHNNLQPYNTVNYIIKAKMTAVPVDFMSAMDEAVEDVYGNIIPSDASASNMLVTENNKGIGKSVPSTLLSSAGWYKICAVSSRNQGTGFTINLGSSYVYTTSCMHMINFAYSYKNGNMTEIAKDDAGVFDKIRCVYVDNSSKNIILVHYNISTSNDCHATINCSYKSNALEIFNFEAVDESEYANYIEYDLGTDGAYQNGKLLVTNTVETGSITVGTLPTGISSLSLVYRQQGSICFIRVACVVNVAGEYSIPITLPFTPTEGGAGTKGILAAYDSTNNTEHIGECFINSTHNALTLRTTYATGYNGTLTYLLSS